MIADTAPGLSAERPEVAEQLVSYMSTIEVMNSDPEILDKLRSDTHVCHYGVAPSSHLLPV